MDALEINEFQRALLDTYMGGEFAFVKTKKQLVETDRLLQFMFAELDSTEDCETQSDAIRRMEAIEADVRAITGAIRELPAIAPAPAPADRPRRCP